MLSLLISNRVTFIGDQYLCLFKDSVQLRTSSFSLSEEPPHSFVFIGTCLFVHPTRNSNSREERKKKSTPGLIFSRPCFKIFLLSYILVSLSLSLSLSLSFLSHTQIHHTLSLTHTTNTLSLFLTPSVSLSVGWRHYIGLKLKPRRKLATDFKLVLIFSSKSV